MPASLREIVENKYAEVEKRKAARPLESFQNDVTPCNFEFEKALQAPGVKLICEIKPKSPSAGTLNADVNVDAVVALYSKYAKGISVLADEKYFGGSIELLRTVSQITAVPTLCKDFVVDPYQCFEARDAGAKAILLIVKILSDRLLRDLHEAARKLGLTALVEVQTEEELRRAVHIDPSVILINNRNLDTFVISLETTEKLALQVPDGPIIISASGINTAIDIEKLLPFSTTFLIGSALMQSQNMDALLSELVSADLKCTGKVNG